MYKMFTLQNSVERLETEPLLCPQHISIGAGAKRKVVRLDPEDHTAPDPDLVFAASKFVKDILEKAKVEAAKRLKAQNLVSVGFKLNFKYFD